MQSSNLLIGIGALLILGGIVLTAVQTLWRGRLSDAHTLDSTPTDVTLEPRGRSRTLGLKGKWPGLGLIALGAILLIAAAAV